MTQKTIEKFDRAIKALETAKNSFCSELIHAKTMDEIRQANEDWTKLVDLVCAVKKFRDDLETKIYLNEKQGA